MTRTAAIALSAIVAAFLALWGAYSHGVSVEAARGQIALDDQRKALAEANAEALSQARKQDAADLQAAIELERKRLASEQQVQTVFRTITKTVTEYVHANPDVRSCGLDDDGLRIWQAANRGTGDASAASADRR